MKKFRKGLFGVLLGGAFLVSCFGAYQRVKPSEQVMQSLKLTLDGTTTGTTFFEANNGYVFDGSGNLFATYGIIDTGFNNTGSDTLVPSEKAVYNQIGLSLSGYQTGYEARGMTIDSTLGDLIYTKTTPNNPKTRIQMGGNATASNLYSMALGFQSYAYGDSAVAILGSAGGTSSICIGVGNVEGPSGINIGRGHSVGNKAITIGEYSEAYGENSVAIGYQNIANTKDSFAMGAGTLGNSTGGISLGSYNLGLTNSLFELGNGTGISNRSNALTILTGGFMGILTSTPSYALDVSGAIAGHSVVLSDVAGVVCVTTGQIIFSGGNFLGCNGSSWLQLN